MSDLRVVAIGGGAGLSVVMTGLRRLPFNRTYGERGQPGSVVAIAGKDGISAQLLRACGILGPLGPVEPDDAEQALRIPGQVFPATTDAVRLKSEQVTGGLMGEVPRRAGVSFTPIRRVALEPERPEADPAAIDTVLRAGLVVLGPGSLYTSLISVLLVEELADAIRRSGARVVLVMNLTTEPGQTDRYTAVDHLLAVRRHAPVVPIHDVLINGASLPESELARPASGPQVVAISPDVQLLRALGHRPVARDLLAQGPGIRHDPQKLATALLDVAIQPGR